MAYENYKDQDLTGTDFTGTDCTGNLFRGANLTNCNFTDAIMDYANMRETTIEGADFTRAQFHYSNIKDATGTADWTDTRVSMAPTWVDFIGADTTTQPPSYIRPEDREILLEALLDQNSIGYQDLTPEDQTQYTSYINDGYKVIFTGVYGDMPTGRNVYTSIDEPYSPTQPWSVIVNMHIDKETIFDTSQNLFILI